MEVFKRPGSPSWYADLTHPVTGNRLRVSLKFTGSKVAAQKKARELEAELEREAKEADANGKKPITIKEALDRYIRSLTASGKTLAAREHAYRRDRLLGLAATAAGKFRLDPDRPLHGLTTADLADLALARAEEGRKPQTIKHEIGLLRTAARDAAEGGYRVPVDIKWKVPKVGQKTRYLSPQEYETVVQYLDPDRPVGGRQLPSHQAEARGEVRDLVVALAYTGARWSEVAHLTWDRVDLRAGVIRLFAGKVQRERIVPIADPLGAVLRARFAGRRVGVNLVFPGPAGRPRSQPSGAIGEAMTAVGLNEPDTVAKYGRATIHSLRHTFASWLIQNGADLGEVADALGHASLNMTRRYAHLSKGATVAKLGGILNGIGTGTGGPEAGSADAGGRGMHSVGVAPEGADQGS